MNFCDCWPAASWFSQVSMVCCSISRISSSWRLISSSTLPMSKRSRRWLRWFLSCFKRSRRPRMVLPSSELMPRCIKYRIACCKSPNSIRSSDNALIMSSALRDSNCEPSHSEYLFSALNFFVMIVSSWLLSLVATLGVHLAPW